MEKGTTFKFWSTQREMEMSLLSLPALGKRKSESSPSILPTVGKTPRRRLVAYSSACKPSHKKPRTCRGGGFAVLDFSDLGALSGSAEAGQDSEQQPWTKSFIHATQTKSKCLSSQRTDLGPDASALNSPATLPSPLHASPVMLPSPTMTLIKQPRFLSTPINPHRASQHPSSGLQSLCDPICLGFFAPHKFSKNKPCFPKCLAVVLRDPVEPQRRNQGRRQKGNDVDQAVLFQDVQAAQI